MYFSDKDFADKVNDKLGNVKFFKKCLRDLDLIGSRQKLSDDYIEMFKEVKAYRGQNNSTWELAMNEVLPKYTQAYDNDSNDNQLGILKEILAALKRIEQKL